MVAPVSFDLDTVLEDCVGALREPEPRRAVREVLARAIADPGAAAAARRPESAGITLLHHTSELTVIDVVWAPGMSVFAHDHRMWAAIAVYAGKEDNLFFRRERDGALQHAGGRSLGAGDVLLLGDDVIHAVTNPASTPTGALHVYGGDFVNQPRSQWLAPALVEEPYDSVVVADVFAKANAEWQASRTPIT